MLSKAWRWARGTCAERQPVTGSTSGRSLCAPGSCPKFEICCRRKLIFRGMPIRSPSHTRCAAATHHIGTARAYLRAGRGSLSAMRAGLAGIAAWVLCALIRGEDWRFERGVVRGSKRIATMTARPRPCQVSSCRRSTSHCGVQPLLPRRSDCVTGRECTNARLLPPRRRRSGVWCRRERKDRTRNAPAAG